MAGATDEWWVWTSPDGVRDEDLELLESGIFSDAQVRCRERIWKVHKAILCVRSQWFRKALAGSFKEAETGIVSITEFEEDEVDCLLRYIYTGRVNVLNHFPRTPRLTVIIQMWKIGDFFRLEDLCKVALQQCDEDLRISSSRNAALESKRPPPQEKVSKLAHLVRGVYQEKRGDAGKLFRPPLLALLLSSIHVLSRSEVFKDLLRELPELASDWAVALTSSIGSGKMPERSSDTYAKCKRPSSKSVNVVKWIKEHEIEILCMECFPLQRLEDWTGEDKKSK